MAANLSAEGRNLPALVLGVLLMVVIICGNLLVCLSVLTEKALKTTTNYFIVSLAVADLMLAVLVLPLFVYSEVRLPTRLSHSWADGCRGPTCGETSEPGVKRFNWSTFC